MMACDVSPMAMFFPTRHPKELLPADDAPGLQNLQAGVLVCGQVPMIT